MFFKKSLAMLFSINLQDQIYHKIELATVTNRYQIFGTISVLTVKVQWLIITLMDIEILGIFRNGEQLR